MNQPIDRPHTITSISTDFRIQRRTVQLWLQKAKADGHDLGELIDDVRHFSDEERGILVQYGKTPKTPAPTDFIEEDEPPAIATQVDLALPERFSANAAIARFDGALGMTTDPLQIVDMAQAMYGAMGNAIQHKIDLQQQELQQHEEALQKLKDMEQSAITDLKIRALESRLLAQKQNAVTNELQQQFGKISDLGKSE
ncbi:hypothetical protein ACQ4M4_12795 [Leptolyngbya sp. AN02str]|uniref:hypothetical protein n=1 Tax=Leptolyngbya sp. AN02str TaxID=3423363 RepID=UPI003D32317D